MGYVIDEKGQKIEGKLTVLFKSIDDPNSNIADLTTYGKQVSLTSINKKGKTKRETYKSKNGIRFCVEVNEKNHCFLGLKTMGTTEFIGESVSSFSLDFSKFYKVLYEAGGYFVLTNPSRQDKKDFVIKIPSQEKGLYINKSNIDTLKKNLLEYANCNSINFDSYDFSSLTDLIYILNEIKENCNK